MSDRLGVCFGKALAMALPPGRYLLDAYNNSIIVSGVSFVITTRISASNHYWLLDIDE